MLAGIVRLKFSEYFPMTRIINLRERHDRRREVVKELGAVGMLPGSGGVEFIDAIRPANAAGFPTPAVRGCFLSHLEILREAKALGSESVLIIEDDLSISPLLPEIFDEVRETLDEEPWGIVYFGYSDSDKIRLETERKMVRYTESIGCAHFYAIHRRILTRLLDFLETVQRRSPGDPAGGPMHYDGALATFRAQNPDVVTLIAYPCLGFQRSSRSDIYIRWYERVPVLKQAADLARIVRARLRQVANTDVRA
jgi:glycosyl transferase family 25